ncbi:Hypothetical predicted protein [Olea europaea subsp. europaea]|uniref:Uncharacterized protein n=1 Tax=Olea europaea subsp. europaea TaxID=158383 RepID=A0A8S0S8S4_OLEEU|nr:Hypothetical predicted protein [Olea europaea subsp. europaea]
MATVSLGVLLVFKVATFLGKSDESWMEKCGKDNDGCGAKVALTDPISRGFVLGATALAFVRRSGIFHQLFNAFSEEFNSLVTFQGWRSSLLSTLVRTKIDMIGAACESAEKIIVDTRKAYFGWGQQFFILWSRFKHKKYKKKKICFGVL